MLFNIEHNDDLFIFMLSLFYSVVYSTAIYLNNFPPNYYYTHAHTHVLHVVVLMQLQSYTLTKCYACANQVQAYNFIVSIDLNRSIDAQSRDPPPQCSYWYSVIPYSVLNWKTKIDSSIQIAKGSASTSLEIQSIYVKMIDGMDRSREQKQIFIEKIDTILLARHSILQNLRVKKKHFIEIRNASLKWLLLLFLLEY